MAFYSKEATLLVYDQVNRDNPDLPSPLTPSNSVITKAAAAVSSNGRNTRATFTRLPGSGMQGSITVYYDRINLTKLFDFSPLIYFPDTVTTQAAALPYINEALGLSLTAADITSPTGNVPKPNAGIKTLTLTITANNPAFLGTLAVRYLVTPVGYYPNSGPGPKYLRVGNTAMGYFGLIQGSDFITRQQVCDRAFLKTKVTAVTAADDVWAKFFYQGKVIYFPTKYIVAGIRWADVYNEGLVYGTNDNGFIPMSPTANQYRTVKKNGYEYIVRLPQCVDGGAYNSNYYNNPNLWVDSEWLNTWGRLFRISVSAGYPARVSDLDPRSGSGPNDVGCALMQQGYNNQYVMYYRSTYYNSPSYIDTSTGAAMYHVFELVLS